MLKGIIFVVFVALSFNVAAVCSATSCSGKGKDVLLSIYPNGSGNVYLQAPADRANLNCVLIEGHYMTLKQSHPLFKEIYSTLLTGIAANKHMTIRIKTGSAGCEVSYVRMFV